MRSICGALLVGHLPVAWFEMDDDFGGSHAEFPCDLYFMDLNGTWTDPDGDGKLSGHPTNVAPEIFVGRLQVDYFSNKWASEVGNQCIYPNLTETSFTASFVGAQPGRWRVQARPRARQDLPG